MKRSELPEALFSKINLLEPYPNSIAEVERMLSITAFYPGGRGLWLEKQSEKWPEIMVLGQDFATVKDFERMKKGNQTDLECPTWRNLLSFFEDVKIDPCNCFFTNAFMGLRKEGPITGKFPGFKSKEFTQRNIEYLGLHNIN